jgi:hypothetical protein
MLKLAENSSELRHSKANGKFRIGSLGAGCVIYAAKVRFLEMKRPDKPAL